MFTTPTMGEGKLSVEREKHVAYYCRAHKIVILSKLIPILGSQTPKYTSVFEMRQINIQPIEG